MSYTAVIDHDEIQRHVENVVNLVKRHCRIGKVRFKRHPAMTPRPILPQPVTPWIFEPTTTDRLPPMYTHKCHCAPGTVCNNAYCPNSQIATCAA